MVRNFAFLILLVVTTLTIDAVAGNAEKTRGDRSEYNLFRPVPGDQLRELVTDRPDKTESPYTVDAGHFQVEMDLAAYTRDRNNPERADVRIDSWAFANTNIRIGLLKNLEFDLIVPVYEQRRTDDRSANRFSRNQGFGDLTLRMKVNFWGNDGGNSAFGAIPFVKIPTNSDDLGNHAVEGGLILPLSFDLPGGWGFGVMTEGDFNEDSDESGYHAEWINSVTVSHDIIGSLGGYVEFFSDVSSERSAPWIGTFDVGLTYKINRDLQVDTGVNLGVTRAADDLNLFVGLSWRF